MTNFTDVSAFNELIGNGKGAATADQMAKQLQLIGSEFGELCFELNSMIDIIKCGHLDNDESSQAYVASLERFRTGVRDGIADVLVTTYGLAHRMGIDADKDMLAVSTSNASKFFTGTESYAAQVCKALADSLGIKVEQRQAAELQQTTEDGECVCVWAFVSADDSDPERPRGKLLKAPGYKPPVFD